MFFVVLKTWNEVRLHLIFCNPCACSIITVTSGKHFIAHMIKQNNCTFHSRKKSSRSSEQTVSHKEISWHADCLICALNWSEMNEEAIG